MLLALGCLRIPGACPARIEPAPGSRFCQVSADFLAVAAEFYSIVLFLKYADVRLDLHIQTRACV